MFLSRNRENNVYPCKPKFYYIKVGFKGVKLYRYVFVMCCRSQEDFASLVSSKRPAKIDQNVRMHRLINVFVRRKTRDEYHLTLRLI